MKLEKDFDVAFEEVKKSLEFIIIREGGRSYVEYEDSISISPSYKVVRMNSNIPSYRKLAAKMEIEKEKLEIKSWYFFRGLKKLFLFIWDKLVSLYNVKKFLLTWYFWSRFIAVFFALISIIIDAFRKYGGEDDKTDNACAFTVNLLKSNDVFPGLLICFWLIFGFIAKLIFVVVKWGYININ